MVYEIGSFIHDLRVERGYSQEELCYGICSTGNLSKIENGIRMPNRKTIEALMQRLGCEDVFLQFSSRIRVSKGY
ncbi:helix-turn-helix domain-containing protein [Roseburia sp. 499]|uniref:helix-turn-helix domain-containing protein n=1 Tax=Roseburia sp. 499 TaxID=1261634 RepID=UPI0009526B35|nr:helix-turn-helix transcriptional regulator [Roseburia sp. 499]WVK69601.1 helix-turn-helix transcriptional regulator [Roseburia sp. 499]